MDVLHEKIKKIHLVIDEVREQLESLPKLIDINEIKDELDEIKNIKNELATLRNYFSDEGFFSKAGKVSEKLNSLYSSIEKLSDSKLDLLEKKIEMTHLAVKSVYEEQKAQSDRLERVSMDRINFKSEIEISIKKIMKDTIDEYEKKFEEYRER